MPIVRPGRGKYATATKAVLHGAACEEKGFVGVAIKQVPYPATAGLGSTLITTVQTGEQFFIITKGEVVVANAGSFAEGTAVYMTVATNTLTSSSSGTVKYGRVKEIAPARGLATGMMRVDLDAKAGIP